MVCCYTERFAGGEAKRHVKVSVSNYTFLPTIVAIIVITGLASLTLLAVAIHRRQRGGALQPHCSRINKIQTFGTAAGAVDGGQTLESAGLLPRSSYGLSNQMSKAPLSPVDRKLPLPAAATQDSRHHPSAVRGTRHCCAPPYRPPIWALSPPPPPPPSSVVDDVFSEYASTIAVFPPTDNYDELDRNTDVRTVSRLAPADEQYHDNIDEIM